MSVGVYLKGGARGLAVHRHRNRIGERMPDKLSAHAVLIVEALFERQQAQHQVHGFVNTARPALPPSPDLRTDVLHGRDAGAPQVAGQAQIEFGRIDTHEYIRPSRKESGPDIFGPATPKN